MNKVHPIKNLTQVTQMADHLKSQSQRNYILFRLGTSAGLRISDIIKIKVHEIRNKSYLTVRENKTGKEKTIPLKPELIKELKQYTKGMNDNDFLIGSREYRPTIKEKTRYIDPETGKKKTKYIEVPNTATNSPITRETAWYILKEAAKTLGIEDENTRIGCHSLRKTTGYHIYKNSGHNIGLVQKVLNQSDTKSTLSYIGIDQEQINDAYLNCLPY